MTRTATRWPFAVAFAIGMTAVVALNTLVLPGLWTSHTEPPAIVIDDLNRHEPTATARPSARPTALAQAPAPAPAATAVPERVQEPSPEPSPTHNPAAHEPASPPPPTTEAASGTADTAPPEQVGALPTPTPNDPPARAPQTPPTSNTAPALEIFFDLDRDTVGARALTRIAALVAELRADERLHIECSTDSFGADWFNTQLSQNRCDAVARALVARGLDRSRVSLRSLGEVADHTVSAQDLAPSKRVARIWRR